MYFVINWQIQIGNYKLGMLDSVEVHKSVELLADTCTIKLPATLYNKAIELQGGFIENKIQRGNEVKVWLGYNINNFNNIPPYFEGYMLNHTTDDGSLVINCEDNLFLLRKAVKDKQFKAASINDVATYIVQQTGNTFLVDSGGYNDANFYEKFVISNQTGYDVLKKIADETKANIYITTTGGKPTLHIHPPYIQQHGYVAYSFQHNIESSELKYKNATDRVLQIEVESTGKDGKKTSVFAGNSGGDKKTIKVNGISKQAMQQLANDALKKQVYDGYEGSINTWLLPHVAPGYSAKIIDEEYIFKNGWYYVKSVTTTCSSGGIVNKVDIGIKLANV